MSHNIPCIRYGYKKMDKNILNKVIIELLQTCNMKHAILSKIMPTYLSYNCSGLRQRSNGRQTGNILNRPNLENKVLIVRFNQNNRINKNRGKFSK